MPLRYSTAGTRNALLGLSLAALLMSCWGSESPSEKKENAFLQDLEFEHRTTGAEPRCLIKRSSDDQYCAAGFWSGDANERIWVLVRPASDPLKVLPRKPFSVHPEDIEMLTRECGLTGHAADQLRQSVGRSAR